MVANQGRNKRALIRTACIPAFIFISLCPYMLAFTVKQFVRQGLMPDWMPSGDMFFHVLHMMTSKDPLTGVGSDERCGCAE